MMGTVPARGAGRRVCNLKSFFVAIVQKGIDTRCTCGDQSLIAECHALRSCCANQATPHGRGRFTVQ